MKEITQAEIKKYKESYLNDNSNLELTHKFKINSISDIAFNEKMASLHPFEFSIEIPMVTAVSQGYTGRCWIVAGLNLLRILAIGIIEFDGVSSEEFHFSNAYVCFWDKVEKANCFLEKVIETRNEPYDKREVHSWFQYAVTDGGFWSYFTALINKYGLVPSQIMPETVQSENTEEMNNRLNYYIRKISADIRNAHSEGKSIDEIYSLKEQAMNRIFTFLCRCYGYPTEEFQYVYKDRDKNFHKKTFTPLSFYREIFGDTLDRFVNVISLPYEKLPFGEMCELTDVFQVNDADRERFLNLPIDELKAYCIEQLKSGIPVVCAADDDKMCRDALQLWDDCSFDYENVTGFSFDMSRKDYFQLKAGIASHSMLITGVHIGENGMPKRWKILNSYDTNGLHGGYYTCSDSWFDKYIVNAVIDRKLLTSYDDQIMKEENSFDIWEIM